MSEFNPYAAPTPEIQQHYQQAGYEMEAQLAGRGSRFAAALIDGIISLAIMLPLQINFGVLANFPNIKPLSAGETAGWAVAGFVLWCALHSYFLATRGQTIGKRLVGIQIVDAATGRQAPFAKLIFARYLPTAVVANIPFVGGLVALLDALMIFRDDRRCLHDQIAGTRVVEYRGPVAS
jgi:uncharacterized RDD family membrane protein YckC